MKVKKEGGKGANLTNVLRANSLTFDFKHITRILTFHSMDLRISETVFSLRTIHTSETSDREIVSAADCFF